MILNTKQLEELEAIHDVVSEFDDSQSTSETYDDSIDSAFAWRRGMIEKAIQNVKKASRRFPEPNSNYPTGTLLYDQKQKRFARVSQAEPKLTLSYISSAANVLSAKNKKEDLSKQKPSKTKNPAKKGIVAQPSEAPQHAQKKKPIAQKAKSATPVIAQKATQAKKSKKQVANQAVPKKAAAAQKKKALAQPKHKPKASSAPKPKAAKAKPVFQKKETH